MNPPFKVDLQLGRESCLVIRYVICCSCEKAPTFGLVINLQKLSVYICLEKTKSDSRFFEDPICVEHTPRMGQGKGRRQRETPARQ